jgi:hypothetical protein
LSLRPLLSKPCHPPRDLLSKLGTVRLLAAWKQGREERRLACSDSGEDAQPGRWIWCLRRWNCKPCSLGREARANWIWRGGNERAEDSVVVCCRCLLCSASCLLAERALQRGRNERGSDSRTVPLSLDLYTWKKSMGLD